MTHENCEGSISLTRRTRNSKKPSRTRVRSWKHQWLVLCRVKLWKIVGVVHPTKLKQDLRVFWKLVHPQDCEWENLHQIIMKTILQEKGTTHCSIAFGSQIYSCASRNGKNWRKFWRGSWQKSEAKKRWSMKQGRQAQKFFCLTGRHMSFENVELEAKHQKNKGRDAFPGDIVKDSSGSWVVLLNKDHQHHKWRKQKSWMSYADCQGSQDKQRMQCLLIPRFWWRILPNYQKFPNRNVQTFGFVYHDTNGLSHGPVSKTQSFRLSGICMFFLAGLLWERQFEKILLKHGWEKVSKLGMHVRTPSKRVILICVCGWNKICWQETKH